MPYLFAMACEASHEGLPLMRAMMLEFPEDPSCLPLDRQYMLGESLLVSPIFREDGTVTYYQPAGRWTNLITNERPDAAGWRTERHGYMSLPLLVRPNSIIAMGEEESRPDYDYADGVTFHLFELEEGGKATARIHDGCGKEVMNVEVGRKGRTLVIETRGANKPWSVCLRNIANVGTVKGGTALEGASGVVIAADKGKGCVTVTLLAD
jgi:alpha-D-xyloside xylohydrolase